MITACVLDIVIILNSQPDAKYSLLSEENEFF